MPKDGGQQGDMLAAIEGAEVPGPIADEGFRLWNEHAKQFGWVTANHNRHGRPGQLRRAIKELGGLHQWKALLEKCGTSDFLCGRTQTPGRKPFSFSLDWALKPANLTKIEDGVYFSAEVRGAAPTDTFSNRLKAAAGVDWKARLNRYHGKKSFWHVDTEGPRPEDPGPHKAPAEMIERWRKAHGVTGVPMEPIEVSREERLSASIASLRKHGYWERANRAEEELAALQKRPPVLVPAPEVASLGMDKVDGRAFDEKFPRAPEYRPEWQPPKGRSEARETAAMAQAQDVEWEMVPEGDDFGGDIEA